VYTTLAGRGLLLRTANTSPQFEQWVDKLIFSDLSEAQTLFYLSCFDGQAQQKCQENIKIILYDTYLVSEKCDK
jgi:hypothetical protein